MKRFLSVALFLALALGSWKIYRVFNPSRPTPFASLPIEEQKKRRVEAQTLVEKVETIARDAKSGAKSDFTLEISDDQLNTLLQDRIKSQNLPIRDVSAALEPGTVVLNGNGDYKGFSAPVVMRGTLVAQNGGAVFNVDSLTVAGVSAPEKWKTEIQKAVGEGFEKVINAQNGVRVDSIVIESGKMTIQGKTGN